MHVIVAERHELVGEVRFSRARGLELRELGYSDRLPLRSHHAGLEGWCRREVLVRSRVSLQKQVEILVTGAMKVAYLYQNVNVHNFKMILLDRNLSTKTCNLNQQLDNCFVSYTRIAHP